MPRTRYVKVNLADLPSPKKSKTPTSRTKAATRPNKAVTTKKAVNTNKTANTNKAAGSAHVSRGLRTEAQKSHYASLVRTSPIPFPYSSLTHFIHRLPAVSS